MNLHEYQRSRSLIDLGTRSLRFNIYKLLSLENARQTDAKFPMEPPIGVRGGGTKVSSNGLSNIWPFMIKKI